MSKQYWFPTLNDALNAEGLLDAWESWMTPIPYGESVRWTWQDGSRFGRCISIYRDTNGRYERPVHYER